MTRDQCTTEMAGAHFQRHGVTALCGLGLRVSPAKSAPSFFDTSEVINESSGVSTRNNRQGFSHRDADAKSLLDEAIRRGMGGARRGEGS